MLACNCKIVADYVACGSHWPAGNPNMTA